MQTSTELTAFSALGAALLSLIVGLYLFYLWRKQNVSMYTDLPFLFGITFIAMFLNMLIQSLPGLGLVEATLLLFRIRSLVIFGSAFPLLAVILIIWFPQIQHHHNKILLVLAIYWVLITLIGTSESLIMILLVPILLVLIIGLVATFFVTWRTNRLKEVRSELMMMSLILSIISQVGGVSLRAMELGWIANLVNAIATILAALAFANPWYRRKSHTDQT
ncbi:MAG: hypothetical protein GF411_12205 [Candidatus Lokiarchaeota archaeon]|nr:hypothetical protein [Candidatus Lokiarchaeota archaeon]